MHIPILRNTVQPMAGTIWYPWKGSFAEALLLLTSNGLCYSTHITGTTSASLPCTFSQFESHCKLSDHYKPILQSVHTIPLMFSLHNWKRQLLIETHLIGAVSDKEVEIAWLTLTFQLHSEKHSLGHELGGQDSMAFPETSIWPSQVTLGRRGALSQTPVPTQPRLWEQNLRTDLLLGSYRRKLTSLMMGRFVNPFEELQHVKKCNPECLAGKGRAAGM